MRLLRLAAIGVLSSAAVLAARMMGEPSTAVPDAVATPATLASLPWATWFEKNTTVSDKGAYVHILWDANAVRTRFEGKDKRALIAEAARQLALLRYPKTATADQIRVDIVFVTQRDEYGNPKWDTLQRVAHLELSRKLAGQAAAADPEKGFQKFEIFR
jgi:anaerobic selenocysteine-containing dehydrogenase